jgi:three-Cys-motif partner protein
VARTWGFWTRNKLDILSAYLHAFTTASRKKARATTVYLDLFAGTPAGMERDTGQPIPNSVVRALNTTPRFTRHYFFELPAVANDLDNELARSYPSRDDYRVVPGDSNETIDRVLSELREMGLDWAPTFAFLDPRNLGVKWTTIGKLADFKRRRRNKIELWVLCFSSAIARVLGGEGDSSVGAEQVTAFYGTDHWQAIKEGRDGSLLAAADAREEYVNLYRWRLENVLGYRITHSFEVKNTSGSPLYHLILATDNETGSRIMRDIYSKAAKEHLAMRREAAERRKIRRDEERGRRSLFQAEEFAAGSPGEEVRYMHEPPWPPYGQSGGGPRRDPNGP